MIWVLVDCIYFNFLSIIIIEKTSLRRYELLRDNYSFLFIFIIYNKYYFYKPPNTNHETLSALNWILNPFPNIIIWSYNNYYNDLDKVQFHDLGNLGGADILVQVERYDFVKAQVYNQQSGFTTKNWIAEADGALYKFPQLILAFNGWDNRLYYRVKWGDVWKEWKLISI